MRTRNFLAILSMLGVMVFVLSGCSGGGSSGSDALSVSSASAVPGEYITLTHDSFNTATPVTVTWSDDQNYSVKVIIKPIAQKILKVPVPVYISLQGSGVAEGNVSILVSGISDTKPFTIRKPITITYGDSDKPGGILMEWFKQNRSDYNNTLNTIQTFGVDTTDFASRLNVEIERINNIVAEYDANSTFTLYYNDSTSKTLSQDELKEGDALLYTAALGMLAANEDITALSSSPYRGDSLNDLLNSETADNNAALQIVKNLRDVIPQIMENVKGGSTLLVGGVTVVAGVAVLVGSISAGTALVIGGLSAGTYAIVTGVHSEGLDWMSSKIDEATLTLSDYEFGGELADKAKDAAISFAFSVGSTAADAAGGVAELAYTGWNLFTSKIQSICDATEPAPSSSLTLLSTSLSDEEQFCSEIEVLLIYKDYFEFTINIPGYTGPFIKEAVAFGRGTVDDGSASYLVITAVSASSNFDPLADDVLSVLFNENLTAPGSYILDDTWITEGGYTDVFFSSHEILEDIDSTHKWPVGFGQTGGTLELEYYGTAYGDRLKGSFVVHVEGSKDTCADFECENYTTEIITGTISGSFDGLLKE
ncbi:hypothetical protein KKG72_04160 [bacterium]|nr:hypothetical protein [bacterium]MBU1994128.1 hypothetical protein [bacterium]